MTNLSGRPGAGSAAGVPGSAHLVLASGVVHLDEQAAVFEAMLGGWQRQQQSRLLAEGTIVKIDIYNGNPIGLELPAQVELTVSYTEPGVRGDTASGNVTKPARLETGAEVRVPFYIKEGEKIKVSTETREFAGRA